METITIREYLEKKGIAFKESNGELIAKCLFGACDKDSRGAEGHLYLSSETGQYHCKKCNASGNIFTLAKALGDTPGDVARSPIGGEKVTTRKSPARFDGSVAERCAESVPERIRTYLNGRGITDETIEKQKIGYGRFYRKNWITIPVPNDTGGWAFLKLRRDPAEEETNPDKYKFYPTGSGASLYGKESIAEAGEVWICEGEFDQMMLSQKGFCAVTSTAGAGTFKREWAEAFVRVSRVVVCFDNDEAGQKGTDRVIALLSEELPQTSVFRAELPEVLPKGSDISNYFGDCGGSAEELRALATFAGGKEPIDVSRFSPIGSKELLDVLGLTIKKDDSNKLATFLCELSAYTESAQINISLNAPSSTGKSYIPTEIAKLFPPEDVIEIGYCSPTSFFHDAGVYNKERGGIEIDLSRKILIFLDQPHTQLLERLRPLLSHDKKEMTVKITDKSQKSGMRTKTIFIKGFPAVIFCSAGILIDEQEGTRFLLLSPEADPEKVRAGIHEKILRETDPEAYQKILDENPARSLLMDRLLAIRNEHIGEIMLSSPEEIEKIFLEGKAHLKPRHQRDIARFIAFVRMFALLNVWFRKRNGNCLTANGDDLREAVSLWGAISESQEYNLSPYVYEVYKTVILPAFQKKNEGLSVVVGLGKHEILKKYQEVHGRFLEDWRFRQQILPPLEASGLVEQERDPSDKRKILIYPCAGRDEETENNRESGGGVKNETKPDQLFEDALDIFGDSVGNGINL